MQPSWRRLLHRSFVKSSAIGDIRKHVSFRLWQTREQRRFQYPGFQYVNAARAESESVWAVASQLSYHFVLVRRSSLWDLTSD